MDNDLIIDLSNYKDRLGSRVKPDRYRVVVEDAEAAESAAKNPMVNLWFKIIGGEFDGMTVTDRLVLTEKSLFRVVGFMQAISLPTPKQKIRINPRQFVGKTLEIDVEDGEPYNGRVRSEVRAYYKIAGANKAPAEASDDFEGLEEFTAPSTSDKVADLPETAPAAPAQVAQPSEVEKAIAAESATSDDADDLPDLDSINL